MVGALLNHVLSVCTRRKRRAGALTEDGRTSRSAPGRVTRSAVAGREKDNKKIVFKKNKSINKINKKMKTIMICTARHDNLNK